MRACLSVLACLYCLAGTLLSTGCEWKPVVREVQPERILEGRARVEMRLDDSGRYVLVSRFDEQGRQLAIVDWNSHRVCMLPREIRRFEFPLRAPSRGHDGARFMMPLALTQGDAAVLRFADEECQLHGEYGNVSTSTLRIALDEDGREVLIYGNGMGVVSIADPWRGTGKVLAEQVRLFSSVARAGPPAPQLMWFVENGQLTQRTLDGTLLLALGTSVTRFTQGLFDTLRVAYVDGGNLFEAVGPSFQPVLIGRDACDAIYRGDSLDRYEPCDARQLVRVGLYTGETQQFERGVFSSYTDTGFKLEYTRDDGNALHLFAEPPGQARLEVVPPIQPRPLVVGGRRLAGLVDCEDLWRSGDAATYEAWRMEGSLGEPGPFGSQCQRGERVFMSWEVSGASSLVLDRVLDLLPPYYDVPSSSFIWIVHHRVRTEAGEQDQRLSMLRERELKLELVASQTPLRDPLSNGRAVRGYSVEGVAAYPVPLLMYLSDAVPLSDDDRLSRGTLNARLLSGELGSSVDQNVTSYVIVSAPLLGVVYGVEEGDNVGLWFAAL